MNAATTPESHTQIPQRGKNPTTLLRLSLKCPKSQPPLFSPLESQQGYHRTSRNSFKTICIKHKAEKSRYNLYLQFLPNGLWGARISYLGGNK